MPVATPTQDIAVRLSDVRLDRGARAVLSGIDLAVPRGSITAVLGPSGSGKSTLLAALTGELVPAAGTVEVLGQAVPLHKRALLELRKGIGVLLQGNGLLTDLTVAENVALPLEMFTRLDAGSIAALVRLKLSLVGLGAAGGRMPSELSGGMRKRAGLARALALDPELLFLDEPTAGLDPIGAAAFDELIKSLRDTLDLTVFLITHDLDTLYAICDRVAVLADKKVIAVDTIPNLLALDHPWIQEYFNGPRGRTAASSYYEADKDTKGALA